MEKSVFSGKGYKKTKTYTRFLDRADGNEGTLVGEKGGGCALLGGQLRCGIGLVPVYNDFGDMIPVSDVPDKVYILERRAEGELSPSFYYGYTTRDGYYEYSQERGGFERKINCNGRSTISTAYSENGVAYTFFAHGLGLERYMPNQLPTTVFNLRSAPVTKWYKGRTIFARLPRTLLFHKPYSPLDWEGDVDEGGEVELPVAKGNIVDLIELSGMLYALFEYGIVRLQFAGSSLDFSTEEVAYSGGKIFGGSASVVAVGGEKLFFLAEDGVYCFDGNKTEKIVPRGDILPAARQQSCNGAAIEGLYYLKYTDEDDADRALIVDSVTKDWYESKKFDGVTQTHGRALAVDDGWICQVLPEKVGGSFKVLGCDFGNRERKHLEELVVTGNGRVRVQMRSGVKTQTAELDMRGNGTTAVLRLSGIAFDIEITPMDDGTAVQSFAVKYQVLRGHGLALPFMKRRK